MSSISLFLSQSSSAPEDTVASLSSSIPAMLHSAAEALERCGHLTEGWGTTGLVRALEVSTCDELWVKSFYWPI